MTRTRTSLAAAALVALISASRAEDPSAAAGDGAPASDLEAAAEPLYGASSDDVNWELDSARPRPAGLLPRGPVSLVDPLIDGANEWLKGNLGLEFGMAYTAVWQDASDGDIDDAAGGDADVFARWRILGAADSGWRTVLGANGEYRHDMGTYAPRDLGDSFGSLWRTTSNFNTQDAALVQAWWEQHLLDDALVVTFGKLDADNYYNQNRFQSDSTAFLSRAFANNPARAHPSNGLGANAKWNVSPSWYLTAGFQDANGDKIHSGFSTIDEHEFFTAAEVGWTPRIEDWGKGAYRLTFWHVEDRDDAGIPSDRGIGLSCEQEIGRGWVPFLRAAWSDGDVTGVERFACGGVGLEGVLVGCDDLTGIGVAWGDPADSSRDEQWGAEVFHRFQLSPDVQLTIGYQYVHSPTDDGIAGDDPVGVFEVRVRVAF